MIYSDDLILVPLWTGYGYMKLGSSSPCGYEYQLRDLIPEKWSYILQNFTVSWAINKWRLMYVHVLEWWTVSALTRGLFWCLFPELRSNEGNKHQNNTRVSTETVRHESTYIILFLTRHNDDKNNDKSVDLHTSTQYFTRKVYVLLMTSQSIADDVTITTQLWRDHVNNDI